MRALLDVLELIKPYRNDRAVPLADRSGRDPQGAAYELSDGTIYRGTRLPATRP